MTIEVVNFEDAFGFLCEAVRATERDPQYAEVIIDMYGEKLDNETFPIEVTEDK